MEEVGTNRSYLAADFSNPFTFSSRMKTGVLCSLDIEDTVDSSPGSITQNNRLKMAPCGFPHIIFQMFTANRD